MKEIKTLPVYSKLADSEIPENIAAKLPQGWHLSQHQLETYNALAGDDYDVIFNTAMTGDGKSLAAFLRALQDDEHVIAMYPTNELIRDQHGKMPEYVKGWKSKAKYDTMFGARITALMAETKTDRRVEQISKILSKNNILLTNPDLFHLSMSFQQGYSWEQKELPFELPANFEYFVFDEFHTFAVPQIVDVINAINYIALKCINNPADHKQFLFLSATPGTLMIKLLANSGFRVKEVTGSYNCTGGDGWRQILHLCEVNFDAVSPERSTELWVKEHLAEIVQFYRDYPKSKGAIIVNSVATAKRLISWLKENLPPDLDVGENTGLTSKNERKLSFDKALMVCTSTVDVGVDFRINLLIFETTSAGTFVQRFGRLGRHKGFGAYRAYALLPQFILERLEKELYGQIEVEREQFHEYVKNAYPDEKEFRNFVSRWGILQTAHTVSRVKKYSPTGDEFVIDLIEKYKQVFPKAKIEKQVKRYCAMSKNEEEKEILAEIISFRGRSPLSCGLWDLTDNHLKTYNLFFLLANTEFELISKAKFMAEVNRRGLSEHDFNHQLLYVKLHNYVPEWRNFLLGTKRDLSEHPEFIHQARALKFFYIKESDQQWVYEVNKLLRKKRLVCVISDIPAYELKRTLWLPMMFPIHRLSDKYDSEYSIAFGKEALLLESLLFYRKPKSNNPFIC